MLQAFPYVNGALFRERLDFAAFNAPMRKALLDAANFRWSAISPAIFGALFQEVMNSTERRKIGAHYTSERDILKVIRPLFLDKLREEFAAIEKDRSGRRANRLEDFRLRLTKLKFLDPACGCGNFLVIAYRELRLLELDVLKAQHSTQQALTLDEVNNLSKLDVDQFYGIEIEEWPARIAEVAMWLMDHQMNRHILAAFSQDYLRLPLKASPHIHLGNALRMDWNDLLPAPECSYILGNPPFVGKKEQSSRQKKEVLDSFPGLIGAGTLDYVACWYSKAASYIAANVNVACGFVSTNSITQGEQVAILWSSLLKAGLKILFAHRTFEWTSEARGKAHVHVVIIGFGLVQWTNKTLFSYSKRRTTPEALEVNHINPYLIQAPDVLVHRRTKPLSEGTPSVRYGSMPIDAGCLTYTTEERERLISEYPQAERYVRPYWGGEEYIGGTTRFCLWLVGADLGAVRNIPPLLMRIESTRLYRGSSGRTSTQRLAKLPWRFGEIRQPKSQYLLIPKVSSESRQYIPIGYCPPTTIASGSCLIVPLADSYAFGTLSSATHSAWMRYVGGRMKSDYQYSAGLVYNNFPWPPNPTQAQRTAVEREAQAVLDARALYPDSTLAALYDPLLMPPELVKAHQRLDRAVERCYRKEPFTSDRERVEFLFALYEQLIAPLLPAAPKRRRKSA